MKLHLTMNALFLVLLALLGAIHAATAETGACSQIETLAPHIERHDSLQLPYTAEQNAYWSTLCGSLKPACILHPNSAQQVSTIVGILNNSTDSFAIKSGGHNPNLHFASVAGGPLISTRRLNQISLEANSGTVRVGPGNRWQDVAEKLDGTGWSVVGGRVGEVGVGGYLLGGGLSFMSQEYGWAVSSVLEMEVVLANGTIVIASATHNPDLFLVLKGGGNNFGIVTSFLLQAYRQGDVYGGNLVFPRTQSMDAQLLQAVRDFTQHNHDDKAAIILTAERALLGLLDIWIMFIYYNGPVAPVQVFKNFTDLKPVVNSCKTRSYANLLVANNWASLHGLAYTVGTETIALPPAEKRTIVLDDVHQHWRDVSTTVLGIPSVIASIAYQPIPRRIARIAREKGGDLLDLDDDVDHIIIQLDYSVLSHAAYPSIDRAMRDTYEGIRQRVHNSKGGDGGEALRPDLPPPHLPLFANDAFYAQDYCGRLRPKRRELARAVAAELDPHGLLRNRTGGFKP